MKITRRFCLTPLVLLPILLFPTFCVCQQTTSNASQGVLLPQNEAEPVFSPEELKRWEGEWETWDAFLTYVIKHAASDTEPEELRQGLLEVLLDARHGFRDALASSAHGAPDPVRVLFIKSWQKLVPILRHISEGLPGDQGMRYLTLLEAAEVLEVIDRVGPEIGIEISADGLRRLARILAPSEERDPLAYSFEVDPELRAFFGFGPPLQPPEVNTKIDLSRWFWSFAWAGQKSEKALSKRLNGWVPEPGELETYLQMVRDLLHQTVDETLKEGHLEKRFHSLYRWMVLATAWQESCWRQFIREGKKIKPLRSSAGSVGLMQINERVWRGFYEVKGLRGDIGYNASAGSEILIHYLVDYAIKKEEHTKTGRTDYLARATYAVYNGGPGHLIRYRDHKAPKELRKIDEAFWVKYTTVKGGNEFAVASCYSGVEALHGIGSSESKSSVIGTNGPGRQHGNKEKASLVQEKQGRGFTPKGIKDEAWLLKQNPSHYTLQLVAAQSENDIVDYISTHGLTAKGSYYRFVRDGKAWFGVAYGVFATRLEAEQAVGTLPKELSGVSPWIRDFAGIQKEIRKAGTRGTP